MEETCCFEGLVVRARNQTGLYIAGARKYISGLLLFTRASLHFSDAMGVVYVRYEMLFLIFVMIGSF